MKNVFRLTFFICLVFHAISGMAQSGVSYVYDSAGNRVSRTIILTRSLNPEDDYFLKETVKERTVKIYPSATRVKVVVENFNEDYPIRSLLYDAQGALLLSTVMTEASIDLDIKDYSTGMYILKIIIGDYSSNWKFVKK